MRRLLLNFKNFVQQKDGLEEADIEKAIELLNKA